MFSKTKSLFAAAALLAVLPSSLAQDPIPTGTATADQRRIQACAVSIETPGFMNGYEFAVNDATVWSQTYTYSYEACQNIPVLSSRLTNYGTDGTFVTCTYEQFTTAGQFTSVCQRTRGSLASAAGPEGADYSIQLRTSSASMLCPPAPPPPPPPPLLPLPRPLPPPPPNSLNDDDEPSRPAKSYAGMICDAGETACPMRDSRKRSFSRCIDTANELYACGGCPGAAGTQDCSELKGVADVQCVQGTCQINQCDRSHKLSSDGKSCIRKDSVAKRSFW